MHTRSRANSSEPEMTREALKEFQTGLRTIYGAQAPAALVYGSTARGEYRADSDLDVLLIYAGDIHPGQEIHRISGLLADLNLRYQVLISIVPVSQEEYREASGAFWKNVRSEGKIVQSI